MILHLRWEFSECLSHGYPQTSNQDAFFRVWRRYRRDRRLRSGEIVSSSPPAVSGKKIATMSAAATEASISIETARQ